jgi:hypothetical protein
MTNSTDEILKRIQERLDARGETTGAVGARGNASLEKNAFLDNPPPRPGRDALNPAGLARPLESSVFSASATALSPEQIISEVWTVAPTQISFIAEVFANSVADAMNMRIFAPKIRKIAEESLRKAFAAAKKQGRGIGAAISV